MDKTIFISHASVDKPRLTPYIAHLLEKIESLSNIVRLWIDRPAEIPPAAGGRSWATHPRIKKIPSGTPWLSIIQEQVANSDCVLVFLSDRAWPERKQVFAGEILKALFDHKCVVVSLDPITQRDPPDLILGYVQITDVSKFAGGTGLDDGAFDSAIEQIVSLIEPRSPAATASGAVTSPSIAVLVEAANKQRNREIALISSQAQADGSIVDKKYLPNLYVQRAKLTNAFEQFKDTARWAGTGFVREFGKGGCGGRI